MAVEAIPLVEVVILVAEAIPLAEVVTLVAEVVTQVAAVASVAADSVRGATAIIYSNNNLISALAIRATSFISRWK